MKRRKPHARPVICGRRALAAIAAAVLSAATLAQLPEDAAAPAEALPDTSDWYRIEVLVFVRDDAEAFGEQQWDPLPALAYPQQYRYLVEPAVADTRLEQSGAIASRFDARGLQTLVLPWPISGVEMLERPDALLEPLPEDTMPTSDTGEESSGAIEGAQSLPDAAEAGALAGRPDAVIADEQLPADDPAADELEEAILALPFKALERNDLEFRTQAGQLRRQGKRIMFHTAWWAPLVDAETPVTVVLDRSGDVEPQDWPALQGSLRLYRTRYLHAEFDLWLNTNGPYLPAEWKIPPPPLAEPSFRGQNRAGEPVDPFAAPPTLEDLLPTTDDAGLLLPGPLSSVEGTVDVTVEGTVDGGANVTIAEGLDVSGGARANVVDGVNSADADQVSGVSENPYPYRHAIVHRQASRMRGGEIHYLDHPVIGIIIRVTPADEDNPPHEALEQAPWRERHGLPAQRITLPAADEEPLS